MRFIIVLLFFAPLTCFADDFRGLSWGDSPTDVARHFGQPEQQLESGFVYTETLVGQAFNMGLAFELNHLVQAGYSLNSESLSSEETADTFEALLALLREKYGPPDEKVIAVPPDTSLASALQSDNATANVTWETERTKIVLFLMTYKGEPTLLVNFSSRLDFTPPADPAEDLKKL